MHKFTISNGTTLIPYLLVLWGCKIYLAHIKVIWVAINIAKMCKKLLLHFCISFYCTVNNTEAMWKQASPLPTIQLKCVHTNISDWLIATRGFRCGSDKLYKNSKQINLGFVSIIHYHNNITNPTINNWYASRLFYVLSFSWL